MRLALLVLAAVAVRAPEDARAQVSSKQEASARAVVVPLHNGANLVDLLGNGLPARVFVAWRENYNAHGFSVVTFYVRLPGWSGEAKDSTWQILPFFDGPGDPPEGSDAVRTAEGADCTLSDLRVVQRPEAAVQVVVGHRALGQSYADAAAVEFRYYELQRNTDGLAGWPTYYFQLKHTVKAKRQYCDVNEAFARELGLSAHGLGHGEGGR